jgi:putative MFS transporter
VRKECDHAVLYDRLEQLKVGRFHYTFLVTGGFAWAFNAISVMILAFALPSILKEWNLPIEVGGVLGTVYYVGMFLGASTFGLLADNVGRKPTVQLAVVIYAITTGLCSFAWDPLSLGVLRFLGGIGTGGIMPVLSTWLSEYTPKSSRGKFVAVLESSWSLGALFISALSWLIIPTYGWRSVFLVSFVAVFFVFLIRRLLPESIRFLEEKGRTDEALVILRRHGFDASPASGELPPTDRGGGGLSRLLDLLSPALRRRTVMLWVLWFCIAYSYHGIFIWLPTILYAEGLTLVRALWYSMLITSLQIPGYLSAAYLIEVVGRKCVLVSYMALAAVSSYFFGTAGAEWNILLWGGCISFFNLGAWGVTYAYTPELYPTRIRGTGAGWSGAVGRIAGILAPSLTAVAVSSMGTFETFMVFFGLQFVAAVVVAALAVETKGRTLEQISP